jgi:transcriptional regulator of arginine metabolism
MNKQTRQVAIREIILHRPIGHQEALRLELKKRGFAVTQATLSRDLRELGIGRTPSNSGSQYVLKPAAETHLLEPVVQSQVVSLAANENVIIVRTLPGCASVVAEYIDTLADPDILGTLAGDNTLMVIPASQSRVKKICAMLNKHLIEGKQ